LALVFGEALISEGRRASSESVVEGRKLPFCADHRFQCVTAAGSQSFTFRRKSASGTAANESTASAQNDISEECRLTLYLLADPGEGLLLCLYERASVSRSVRPSMMGRNENLQATSFTLIQANREPRYWVEVLKAGRRRYR
jgi:hypothetical protein